MSEYKDVPVDAAKCIATFYDKSIVIIACWDREHNKLHTTTYGVLPEDKVSAAKGGEIVAAALGTDLTQKQDYEDFRHDFDAGRQTAMLEAIQKHVIDLRDMANRVISPTPNRLHAIVMALEAATAEPPKNK